MIFIVVDFNLHGLNHIGIGWNTHLQWMRYIVYLATFLEILHILASNVRNAICEEIGDAKFCILVDETRNELKREQIAIILRFVDKNGFIKERFFHVVHVRDTTALTLKEIFAVLSHYNLHIENIRGQGLQLALVTASREVKVVHQFFDHLTNIINIVVGSSKHNDELQYAQGEQIENMIAFNEIKTGREANQIGTLQRAGVFFHVVHVRATTALTLKNEIYVVLSRYKLHIENIQDQGYDGANNMHDEWNGLQALFLKECPSAYYVHCMAHRLQLALVTASREVKVVHQFFDHLTNIINIVVGSSKRNDELQYAQGEQIANMIASNEIETRREANQIGILQ
nr:uncharacterized protein LOC112030155 [Quercus suber]